jgi:acyl carrier protein
MKTIDQSRHEIAKWLMVWFARRSKIGQQTPEKINTLRATNYFDAGWLSSMETVELVTEIEQHFGTQFSDSDLQDSRFATINGLAELILESSAQMSGIR